MSQQKRRIISRSAFNLLLLAIAICFVQCSTSKNLSETSVALAPMLKTDISYLASDALEGRSTGEKGEKLAAEYIVKRMKEAGLEPKGTNGFYQDFGVKNKDNPHGAEFAEKGEISVRNVIGFLDNNADHTVVIGAHYDHLGWEHAGSLYPDGRAIHNGADDNASGVAGMLYLMNALKGKNTGNNYLFIGFSGEEYGLWGSNYYTKNPTIDLDDVTYMLNMDMIGRLNQEGVLSINGVGTSPSWKEAMADVNIPGISTVTTDGGMGGSDHTSFYISEIPAVHFFTGQHEDYHKPSDDEDKINYEGLAKIMDYMMALIEELEDDGELVFTETKNEEQARRSFKVTLGVMPDYLYDGSGMRIDGVRPDRPAALAGIEKGDIVLQMGDYEVDGMEGYMNLLAKFNPGDSIMVKVKRGDMVLNKKVTFD